MIRMNKYQHKIIEAFTEIKGPKTTSTIAEYTGRSMKSVLRTLDIMVANGHLIRWGEGLGQSPFHYTILTTEYRNKSNLIKSLTKRQMEILSTLNEFGSQTAGQVAEEIYQDESNTRVSMLGLVKLGVLARIQTDLVRFRINK